MTNPRWDEAGNPPLLHEAVALTASVLAGLAIVAAVVLFARTLSEMQCGAPGQQYQGVAYRRA